MTRSSLPTSDQAGGLVQINPLQTLEDRLFLSASKTFEVYAAKDGVYQVYPRYLLPGSQRAEASIAVNDSDPTVFKFSATGEAENFSVRGFNVELRAGLNTFTIQGIGEQDEQLAFPNRDSVKAGTRVGRLVSPTNVAVTDMGEGVIKVDWFDRSSTEDGFKVVAKRTDGLGEVIKLDQPTDSSSAVLTGLKIGVDYEISVYAQAEWTDSIVETTTTSRSGSGQSHTGSYIQRDRGRNLSKPSGTTVQSLDINNAPMGYQVKADQALMVKKGTASFTLVDSNFEIRNAGSKVYSTWQEAVWDQVDGKILIDDNDGNQKLFVFGEDAAFTVGTAGELAKRRPGSHFETVDPDTRVIALEDLTNWKRNDNDFDDWYVELDINDFQFEVINSGFETANVDQNPDLVINRWSGWGRSSVTMSADDIPGWTMTDHQDLGDRNNQIEIWQSGFGNVKAAEGDQFAEINAHGDSTLYQTIEVIPGSEMAFDFQHRGRTGKDKMNLTIRDADSGEVLFSKNYRSGDDQWSYYNGTMDIPNGTAQVTFEFSSVNTANGNNSTGNFIDAIHYYRQSA